MHHCVPYIQIRVTCRGGSNHSLAALSVPMNADSPDRAAASVRRLQHEPTMTKSMSEKPSPSSSRALPSNSLRFGAQASPQARERASVGRRIHRDHAEDLERNVYKDGGEERRTPLKRSTGTAPAFTSTVWMSGCLPERMHFRLSVSWSQRWVLLLLGNLHESLGTLPLSLLEPRPMSTPATQPVYQGLASAWCDIRSRLQSRVVWNRENRAPSQPPACLRTLPVA